MANFASLDAAGVRCRAQMAAKVWVVAHSEKDKDGVIKARFIRYMSPGSGLANGGWVETQDDSVN